MKVAILGGGAMGNVLAQMTEEKEGFELAGVIEPLKGQTPDELKEIDVIIDFSNPANLEMLDGYCRNHSCPAVIATTGYEEQQIKQIEKLAESVPVVFSANYSLGINVMKRVISEITPILEDSFDIEIIEKHHNKKLDAPSGTAKMLLAAADEENDYEHVFGRDGNRKRGKEIGVHAVRGGTIAGEHTVISVSYTHLVWMYCGYVAISFLGGEVENPQIIPKGMKIAIVIITASYILPTLAGIVSVGPWSEWGVSLDYSSVLSVNIAPWAGALFMIAAVIAQCSIFNALITSASRSFIPMGQDNLVPKFLSKLSPNRRVPVIPIVLVAVVNMILVNLNFEILVTILSPVLFVLYVGLAFAYVKIRKEYPVEKRGNLYYVKSKLAPLYICGGPLIIGVISFFVNGTEYFLLGFIAILAAVVFYPICKWIYGGLYKKDPENNPINPKTRLAVGDIERFGFFFLLFGAVCLIGSFFLVWYEGGWGPAYYLDMYGSGIMSNFWLMIDIARWSGGIMLVLGIVFLIVGKKCDPIPKD